MLLNDQTLKFLHSNCSIAKKRKEKGKLHAVCTEGRA